MPVVPDTQESDQKKRWNLGGGDCSELIPRKEKKKKGKEEREKKKGKKKKGNEGKRK